MTIVSVLASDWLITQTASSDWLRASKPSPPPVKYITAYDSVPLPEVAAAIYNRDGQLGLYQNF